MSDLYVYDMSWTWYEDWNLQEFVHKEKKTSDEFEQDVRTVMKSHIDDYLKQEKGWAGMSDFISYIGRHMGELGYSPLKKQGYFGFFGAYIVKDEDRRSDDSNKVEELIGKENLEKMFKHNEKVEKRDDDHYNTMVAKQKEKE